MDVFCLQVSSCLCPYLCLYLQNGQNRYRLATSAVLQLSIPRIKIKLGKRDLNIFAPLVFFALLGITFNWNNIKY